jgi:hypothetical protein
MIFLLGLLAATIALTPNPQTRPATCQPSGSLVRVSGLAELSGLAVSRSVAGRLWTHNDSGQPTLFSLNTDGAVTGRVRLTGVTLEDWEAVAVGPCPTGSCVFAADIGDNNGTRRRIAVYRFPEPAASQASVAVTDVFYATYPDDAQDAETLLVTPEGALYIVTKGDRGAVGLYRFPRDLQLGTVHPLQRVGSPRNGFKTASHDRVTDGTVSADGQWVVLRTGTSLTFHRATVFLAGQWTVDRTVDLRDIREPQGEAVALGPAGAAFLGGEGGAKSVAGTFSRLTCAGTSD